jgi:thymidylate kinase
MDDIISLFTKTILLKTTSQVIRDRLSTREGTDDMGNTEASRDAVLGWKDWWEDQMLEKGVVVVDANQNPESIAKNIIKQVATNK